MKVGRLPRVLALFAIFYGLIFSDFVCDCAGSCACRAADQGAFAPACERADYSTACGRATYYLGASVIFVVLLCLFTFCAIVL